MVIILAMIKTEAERRFDCRIIDRARIKARPERISPVNQITNPDASGIAALIQGYAARLGLGMTLTKNQMSADKPRIGSVLLFKIFLRTKTLRKIMQDSPSSQHDQDSQITSERYYPHI